MLAPASPLVGSNYDFDAVQPYFLDGAKEEDFFAPPRSLLLPGPGEDIWKKFELLPTPPSSPSRTPPQSETRLSAADHLEAVSGLLDADFSSSSSSSSSSSLLQSFIIQDCMWSSSFAAASRLEKMVSERLAALRTRRDSTGADGASGPQVSTDHLQDLQGLQDLQAAASDCVDPSVVLPRATAGDGPAVGAESELDLDSPPLSSDSKSVKEEEEDAEMDVVALDRTSWRPGPAPLVLKRAHDNILLHNYAAPLPAGKRRRCWSPRSDSEDGDSEDGDRRRTHNLLERRRRDELRRSFLSLRDQVPAVEGNEKAAKALVLKEAAAFIAEVREEERSLLTTKEELTRRSRRLTRRLQRLGTPC